MICFALLCFPLLRFDSLCFRFASLFDRSLASFCFACLPAWIVCLNSGICSNLLEFFQFCSNLLESARICSNLLALLCCALLCCALLCFAVLWFIRFDLLGFALRALALLCLRAENDSVQHQCGAEFFSTAAVFQKGKKEVEKNPCVLRTTAYSTSVERSFSVPLLCSRKEKRRWKKTRSNPFHSCTTKKHNYLCSQNRVHAGCWGAKSKYLESVSDTICKGNSGTLRTYRSQR